jgi:hypothetical protein
MEQLAGVNLQTFLQGISKLPGAAAERLAGEPEEARSEPPTTAEPERPEPAEPAPGDGA